MQQLITASTAGELRPEGRPLVGFYDGQYHDLISGYRLQTNHLHFIAATYDRSVLKLYLNGKLDNSLAISSAPLTSLDPLVIGWKLGGIQGDRFEGLIDELRIYGRALSEEEIWRLFSLRNLTSSGL